MSPYGLPQMAYAGPHGGLGPGLGQFSDLSGDEAQLQMMQVRRQLPCCAYAPFANLSRPCVSLQDATSCRLDRHLLGLLHEQAAELNQTWASLPV